MHGVSKGIDLEQQLLHAEWSEAILDLVPKDSCNIYGPETPRDPTGITCNPKTELARIFFATLAISTVRIETYLTSVMDTQFYTVTYKLRKKYKAK